MVSVYVFKNEVTARGCFGYLVCVAGTGLYSWAKSYDAPPPSKDKSPLLSEGEEPPLGAVPALTGLKEPLMKEQV
eukprot:1185075-Prorocentrum_minimum.AAC.4